MEKGLVSYEDLQNIAKAIRNKNGETAVYKPSEMAQKINNLPNNSNDDVKWLIERSVEEFTIPDGVARIGSYAFSNYANLTSITIPNSVTSIGGYAFSFTSNLREITIPKKTTSIGYRPFYNSGIEKINFLNSVISDQMCNSCLKLTSVIIPKNITTCGNYVFQSCTNLKSIYIYGDCLARSYGLLSGCRSLEYVYLSNNITNVEYRTLANTVNLKVIEVEKDFNASLNISQSGSELIEADVFVNMFNNLKDLTGETAKTISMGSTNLAKLTDEQKAIAINKNWTLT